MGNSGFSKILFPGDVVETKYNSIHEVKAVDIDKNEFDFSQYKDKVCLIVNSASQNAETANQFQKLKELQQKFGSEQLAVVVVPSNQFTNEPGSYSQIKDCYQKKHDINFPILQKFLIHKNGTVARYFEKNHDEEKMIQAIEQAMSKTKEDFEKIQKEQRLAAELL